jgi:hypothetical protein
MQGLGKSVFQTAEVLCNKSNRRAPGQNPHRQARCGQPSPAAPFHAVFRAGRLKKSNPCGLQACGRALSRLMGPGSI